jgi:branched-chain amino acid transport system permease protein
MGNIPGVMVGALLLYYVLFKFLPDAPAQAVAIATSLNLEVLVKQVPNGWPGIAEEISRLKFLLFGLILVLIMLLRPQGLLPSRVRAQEFQKGVSDTTVFDVSQSEF